MANMGSTGTVNITKARLFAYWLWICRNKSPAVYKFWLAVN